MPAGTTGFRISGAFERADYADVLAPAVHGLLAGGQPVRLLVEIGPGPTELELGALWEDVKHAYDWGVRHHADWRRCAVVTDVGWIAGGTSMFGWMSPGEVRAFPVAQLEAAQTWVAG